MSQSNPSVPKFASFRPKPSQTVDRKHEDELKPSNKDKCQTDERDEPSRHHRRWHRSRSGERHKDDSKERNHRKYSREAREVRKTRKEPATPQQEPQDATSGNYVIDRKGDEKNLVYGSVHRYSVPPFHRAGAGSVLGASPDCKIDRDYSDDKGIVLTHLRQFKRNSREKYVFSRIERERPRLLKIRPEAVAPETIVNDADFVPLDSGRGKKRKISVDDGSDSESDQGETHYRSIEGKAKATLQPIDEAFQYASDSDSSGSDAGRALKIESAVKQRSIELSRRTEQSPDDIEAWIALIEHQDSLLVRERQRVTNAEIRSTADIKIHMYEKALGRAQTLQDRERLLLGLMAEGAKIWEIKVQSDRWAQISKDNIDSLVLWKSYLDFRQSNFSSFRHEEIREIFSSRIASLKQKLTSQSISAVQSEVIYEQLLYVLLRFTVFVRESGFVELAVAIWQGNIELNFYTAPGVPQPFEGMIKQFSEFWESEVPRVGEAGSQGWRKYAEDGDDSTVPEPTIDEPEMALSDEDTFKSWITAERSRTRISRVPARTLDDTVEDDPYRVILASDIEDFLVLLPRETEHLRKSLLNALLIFCHLPSMPGMSLNWPADASLDDDLLDYDADWIKENYLPKVDKETTEYNESRPSPHYIFSTAIRNFAMEPESMFSENWFKSFKPWREVYGSEDNSPITYTWVRNTLKQVSQIYSEDDFTEYYLAFEWTNEPTTIKKTAKGLLKQYPSSLRLYNAYAMIEWSRGNKEIANGIYSATLVMSKSMREDDNKDSVYLWKSLIWGYLAEGDNETALRHLLSIFDGTPNMDVRPTPAIFLKTHQYLNSTRDYLLSDNQPTYAVLYAELLILLIYLTTPATTTSDLQSSSQGNITAALQNLSTFCATLSNRAAATNTHALSLLHQSAARLLYTHMQHGPLRPSTLQNQLRASLLLFPTNSIFFTLFTVLSPPSLVSPISLSTLFSDLLTSTNPNTNTKTKTNTTITHTNLPLHLLIIHHYLHTPTPNLHSAHSSLRTSLSIFPSSASLWKLYLLFLTQHASLLPHSPTSLSKPSFNPKSKSTSNSLATTSNSPDNDRVLQAKALIEIWKQALTKTPWCKEMFLLGFEIICGVLREGNRRDGADGDGDGDGEDDYDRDEEIEQELRDIWRVMGEKDLRVHVDLEEVWDED